MVGCCAVAADDDDDDGAVTPDGNLQRIAGLNFTEYIGDQGRPWLTPLQHRVRRFCSLLGMYSIDELFRQAQTPQCTIRGTVCALVLLVIYCNRW